MIFFAGRKDIENMSDVELATELVEELDFSPRTLKELERGTLEGEVREERREDIESKQLWYDQAGDRNYLVVGKTRAGSFVMQALDDPSFRVAINWSTLQGPNWSRVA